MSVRRDEIVRVAGEMFAKKGFLGTTVREIAEESGILSGSLYHHFNSKEALAEEVLRGYYEALSEEFRTAVTEEQDPTVLFARLITISCRGIADYPAAVALVQKSGDYLLQLPLFADLAKMNSEMRNIWIRSVRAGVKEGAWSDDVDPQFVYRSV